MNANANKTTMTLFGGALPMSFIRRGEGRPFLLLHGGAGPGSMMGLAAKLAAGACAVVATHPGFDGEARPEWCARPEDLALAYLTLIERLELNDVVVVGNSFGGWLATEIALRKSPRVAGIVLLNAVGIEPGSADRPIVDPAKTPRDELLRMSFHDPSKALAPASPEAAAVMQQNQRTLRVYAPTLVDPTLYARLGRIDVPSLVAWGESDRVSDVEYGRRFASGIPGSTFRTIAAAGHLPQIEQTDAVLAMLTDFAKVTAPSSPQRSRAE